MPRCIGIVKFFEGKKGFRQKNSRKLKGKVLQLTEMTELHVLYLKFDRNLRQFKTRIFQNSSDKYRKSTLQNT